MVLSKDEVLRTIDTGLSGYLTDQDNIHIQAGLPALLASYTTAPPSFTVMRMMLRA